MPLTKDTNELLLENYMKISIFDEFPRPLSVNNETLPLSISNTLVTYNKIPTEPNEIVNMKYATENFMDKNSASFSSDVTIGGDLTVTGDVESTGTITSSNGVSQGKWMYDIQRVGYYSTTSGVSYLPLNGYIIERTATVISGQGQNEYISFVAPYDGYLEKMVWRSEIAQSGNFRILIWESADGTEVPGTIVGRWDPSVSTSANTTFEINFHLNATSGDNEMTQGNIYAISVDPVSAPYDTNATVVFKWDITT